MTNPTVAGGGIAAGVVPAGTTPGGGAGVAAPAATPSPAQGDARLAEQVKKLETDIGRLKSASQQREGQLQQEIRARDEAYRAQLHETSIAGLDDVERGKAERAYLQQQFAQAQVETQQYQAQLAAVAAAQAYYQYWVNKGVPPNALDLTAGPDAINEAGWAFMDGRLSRLGELEAAGTQPPAAPPGPPPETPAPPVVTTIHPPHSGAMSWPELRQKYGSDENVYRLVETGQLPKDIIPDPSEATPPSA